MVGWPAPTAPAYLSRPIWLRSSVVSVLISLIADIWDIVPVTIKCIFLGGDPPPALVSVGTPGWLRPHTSASADQPLHPTPYKPQPTPLTCLRQTLQPGSIRCWHTLKISARCVEQPAHDHDARCTQRKNRVNIKAVITWRVHTAVCTWIARAHDAGPITGDAWPAGLRWNRMQPAACLEPTARSALLPYQSFAFY